jgi:hypothetical protein
MAEPGAPPRQTRRLFLLGALLVCLAGVVTYQLLRPGETVDLARAERNVFSQSGEDGVIEAIFRVIEPTRRYSVEFGCGDGVTLSNTRNLLVHHGWSGLLIDGDHDKIEKAKKTYAGNHRVKVVEAWVYPGNIETLFDQHGVPPDLDLISIDIDSNDYYVWRVMHDYRPKVVVIEYNGSFPPPQKAVVAFHPLNYFDKSDYFGASIQSLYELGKKKGYELVYASSLGLNLFFVDKKYFPRFGIQDNSPAALYRRPIVGNELGAPGRGPDGSGHPNCDLEVEVDGKKVKPFGGDMVWKDLRIPKHFVELP